MWTRAPLHVAVDLQRGVEVGGAGALAGADGGRVHLEAGRHARLDGSLRMAAAQFLQGVTSAEHIIQEAATLACTAGRIPCIISGKVAGCGHPMQSTDSLSATIVMQCVFCRQCVFSHVACAAIHAEGKPHTWYTLSAISVFSARLQASMSAAYVRAFGLQDDACMSSSTWTKHNPIYISYIKIIYQE